MNRNADVWKRGGLCSGSLLRKASFLLDNRFGSHVTQVSYLFTTINLRH